MKIRPVGAELFHADGHTNMTKLIVVFFFFCNFANEPKNDIILKVICCPEHVTRYLIISGKSSSLYTL